MRPLLLAILAIVVMAGSVHAGVASLTSNQVLQDLQAYHDNLAKAVPTALSLGPTSKVRAPAMIEEAVRKCRQDRGNVFNFNPGLYAQLKPCWDALEEAQADMLGGGSQPYLPTRARDVLSRAQGCIASNGSGRSGPAPRAGSGNRQPPDRTPSCRRIVGTVEKTGISNMQEMAKLIWGPRGNYENAPIFIARIMENGQVVPPNNYLVALSGLQFDRNGASSADSANENTSPEAIVRVSLHNEDGYSEAVKRAMRELQ
jgi:hypothetical protein